MKKLLMIKVVVAVVLNFTYFLTFAQPEIIKRDKYTQGIYVDFEEFKSNQPSIKVNFDVVHGKSKRWDIKFSDTTFSKDQIKDFWGFSKGDSIFVNTRNYKGGYGFVRLEKIGRYCVFKDQVSSNAKGNTPFVYTGFMSGIAGVVLVGTLGAINSETSILLNINNGKFFFVTKEIMEIILESEQDLLERYNDDKKRKSVETIYKYLDEYNARNKNEIDGWGVDDATVLFYRRDKKQKKEDLEVRINGKLAGQLLPNDIFQYEVVGPNSSEICLNKECFTVKSLSTSKMNYIECSWISKNNNVKLEVVEDKVGEFYIEKVKYLKEKREEEGN